MIPVVNINARKQKEKPKYHEVSQKGLGSIPSVNVNAKRYERV